MYLNSANAELADPRVRQALNWGVDREAINQGIFGGQCTPLGQPLSTVFSGQGHLDNPPIAYGHDVARAKQLLAEAGLPNGFDMDVLVPAGLSAQNSIATVLQAQLGEIGVRLNLVQRDAVQVRAEWQPGTTADGFIHTRTAGPTAEMTLKNAYLLKSGYPGPLPTGFADQVQAAFNPTLTPEQRDGILQGAETTAVDQALDLYLCATQWGYAASDRVTGLENMGQADYQGIFDLRYVGMNRSD
jgi:peptide/nickel transport system substrate-binding protein